MKKGTSGVSARMSKDTVIRLSVVTETWPPEVNGVANTVFQLLSGLLKNGNYYIDLVRPKQKTERLILKHPGFETFTVRGFGLPFYPEVHLGLPQYFLLKKRWSVVQPDIIQVVTEGPLGYAAIKAARSLGIPVFSDFHTRFAEYSKYYRSSGLLQLIQYYLRHLHNQSARTLVPTTALQRELQQDGYNNLTVLGRGVDTTLFHPQRRSHVLRQQLGVQDEELLVILVTRLAAEKNIDLAFTAFRQIQQHVPDARFVLVGDGPERKRLQAEHPDCLFVGMQHDKGLAAYYASADLFLYPSSSETFGLVVIEALASGLPVVAYDYAATALYIQHMLNGMAIPFNDETAFCQAAVKLATDHALRQTLAAEARKTARSLDWQRIVVKLDQIIRGLLAEIHGSCFCSGMIGQRRLSKESQL